MTPPTRLALIDEVDVAPFAGPVIAASAWPAINVENRRVGILVTTGIGIELVPHIVRRAQLVKVFHRRPVHVVPAPALTRTRPIRRMRSLARRAARLSRRLAIDDKETRRQLSPDGTALVIRSHGWYRALRRENTQLISWPIARITEQGVRTADGIEHLVDMLIVDGQARPTPRTVRDRLD